MPTAASLIKTYDNDTVLFRSGDPAGDMYIVHSGKVRILKNYPLKIETIAVMERGDFFGELGVLENLPRNATAIVAQDNTELIKVDTAKLEKMLQENIEIGVRMLKKFCSRFRTSEERLEKLIRDKQALDTGIQDILSHVRRKGEESEDVRQLFGWLVHSESNRAFALRRPEVLIGRKDPVTKQTPDLDISDLDNLRTVSRRHARISLIDDQVFLCEEPGVTNGTTVNGEQIAQGVIAQVVQNDKIKLGSIQFRLHLDLQQPLT